MKKFHSPSTQADLKLASPQHIRPEGAAIGAEEQSAQMTNADWGLDRKRFAVERVKSITGKLKTL